MLAFLLIWREKSDILSHPYPAKYAGMGGKPKVRGWIQEGWLGFVVSQVRKVRGTWGTQSS